MAAFFISSNNPIIMIAPKDELPEESKSESLFPGSSRVYVQGKIHPEVKVAM